jgi:hypothetical protein
MGGADRLGCFFAMNLMASEKNGCMVRKNGCMVRSDGNMLCAVWYGLKRDIIGKVWKSIVFMMKCFKVGTDKGKGH